MPGVHPARLRDTPRPASEERCRDRQPAHRRRHSSEEPRPSFASSSWCSRPAPPAPRTPPETDAQETPAAEERDGALGDPEGTDPLPPLPDDVALPIVFVHGFAGSAQQFESQAMRLVANGYPEDRIVAYDHDGAGVDFGAYVEGLAAVVDDTLAAFGAEQVYLIGHSRGTSVSTTFLSDPAQAAKVAKYIAIDGQPCPEVVPCVAPNQAAFPGQSHVEVATSKESFAMQYEFLVGEEPEVVDIVPQSAPVEISGRAVNFPANTGREATLDIWPIDADSGARVGDVPHATFDLGPDGEFGPVELADGRALRVRALERCVAGHAPHLPATVRTQQPPRPAALLLTRRQPHQGQHQRQRRSHRAHRHAHARVACRGGP